jgi:phospholipid/cholesterol/gamma-HCH transport system permease protein
MTAGMREWADFTEQTDEAGGLTIAFSGPLVVATAGPLDRRLRALAAPVVRIDLTAVPEIDTVGAWIVWRVIRSPCSQAVTTRAAWSRTAQTRPGRPSGKLAK